MKDLKKFVNDQKKVDLNNIKGGKDKFLFVHLWAASVNAVIGSVENP